MPRDKPRFSALEQISLPPLDDILVNRREDFDTWRELRASNKGARSSQYDLIIDDIRD